MKAHRNIIFIIITNLIFTFSLQAETQHEKTEREAAENKMSRLQVAIQRADRVILFYGRVLDQNDQPVAGADVSLSIQKFSFNMSAMFSQAKDFKVKTDSEGNFMVSGESGRSLYVETIQKEGTEFLFKQNKNRGFNYDSSDGQKYHIPDKANPVIFRIRKKTQTPTFLLSQNALNIKSGAAEPGRAGGYDFINNHRLDDVGRRVFNSNPVFPDIQLQARFNTNDATWMVVLSPGDNKGGIILSEQMLYEAPETGYQPEVAFTPENPYVVTTKENKNRAPAKTKYIYLRSREPAIYTRIEIKSASADKDGVYLSGESVTNPYGDRNLERATDLPWEVYKQLSDEVEYTFRLNKRPVRPDLPKLIREAKEKSKK